MTEKCHGMNNHRRRSVFDLSTDSTDISISQKRQGSSRLDHKGIQSHWAPGLVKKNVTCSLTETFNISNFMSYATLSSPELTLSVQCVRLVRQTAAQVGKF